MRTARQSRPATTSRVAIEASEESAYFNRARHSPKTEMACEGCHSRKRDAMESGFSVRPFLIVVSL